MSQLASPVEIYWISGSPFAWRVLLTAEVKGISYQGKLLEVSKGELKAPKFLAINPLGRVPAVRDGNFTLHESLAIMVYLDRKHPNPPLFGRTAEEADRIFERISEFISDFWPPSQRLIRSIFFGPPLAGDEAKDVRERIEQLPGYEKTYPPHWRQTYLRCGRDPNSGIDRHFSTDRRGFRLNNYAGKLARMAPPKEGNREHAERVYVRTSG